MKVLILILALTLTAIANRLNAAEKAKERELKALSDKKDAEIEAIKKEVTTTQARLDELVKKVQVPGWDFNILTLKYTEPKPAAEKK